MKYLLSSFVYLIIFLCAPFLLSAQYKNSIEGDFEALMALYNSTQGQTLTKLNNTADLPNRKDAEPPFMYLIDGDIWRIKFDRRGREMWYNAGRPWLNRTGWVNMTPETMGNAIGVEIDAAGRVVSIDMQKVTSTNERWGNNQDNGNNLAGTLPKEIGNLKKVTYFNVKQNYLTGPIPRTIGNMRSLVWLSLAGQRGDADVGGDMVGDYRGQSDEKGYEERNYFTGSIPPSIGNLANLRVFELRRQPITGSIPIELGNCTQLEYLALNDSWGENSLSGSIPRELGNLTKLRSLDFSNGEYTDRNRQGYNYGEGLTGNVPIDFQLGLISEEDAHINLGNNSLSGSIPEFKRLKNIRTLNLRGNGFTGSFPISYFNRGYNSNMWLFGISDNNLSGEIPNSTVPPQFPSAKNRYSTISVFDIGGTNRFTGPIPQWVQNLTQLIQINFKGAGFSGGFPKKLAEGPRVRLFDIRNNKFGGTLPDVNWQGENLYEILIDRNNFRGDIPQSWHSTVKNYINSSGNYSGRLWRIMANNNNLSGIIPAWIADLKELEVLDLSGNRFTFKDILPNYIEIRATLSKSVNSGNSRNDQITFDLSNQKPFGKTLRRSIPIGETAIFDLSEFDYEGNKYQWMKNGIPVDGATSPVLKIDTVSRLDEGTYRLDVSNIVLPELGSHSSAPLIFEIGPNDGLNGSDNSSGNGNDTGSEDPNSIAFPGAPLLIGPDSDLRGASLQPEFSWAPVSGADYYTLHISRSEPYGMIANVRVNSATYNHPEILDDDARHFWNVRAVKDEIPGEWSERNMFFTKSSGLPEVPATISPVRDSEKISIKPTFIWQSVDADKFEIRIIERYSEIPVLFDVTESTSYTPSTLLAEETSYMWQVKSVKDGVEGAWGPMRIFTTGENSDQGIITSESTVFPAAPTIIGPNDDLRDAPITPKFSWEPVKGADYYTLHISRSRPNGMIANVRVNGTTYNHPEILDDNTRHFWNVRAVKGGEPGEWNERKMFFTRELGLPEVPTPMSPERDAQNVSVKPIFEWQSVYADGYKIRVLDKWTSELILNRTITSNKFMPVIPLLENRAYFWQVKSEMDGVEGAWGPIRVFSTGNNNSAKGIGNEPEIIDGKPAETEIGQNYPNPFNPTTRIAYSLSSPEYVSLKVFDMTGRQVAVLVDEQKTTGRYYVTFNANNLASGVYFYRFVTNTQQFTKKMTLIK